MKSSDFGEYENMKKNGKLTYTYQESGNKFELIQDDCLLKLYKNGEYVCLFCFSDLPKLADLAKLGRSYN